MNKFPNLNATAGSYSFFYQQISINNKLSELTNWKNTNSDLSDQNFREFYKTWVHEINHYLDHTTTIWGLELIYNQLKCLDVISENSIESKGQDVIRLIDDMNLLSYPDFYTVANASKDSLPWRYSTTMGKLYSKDGSLSDRPIVFSSFNNTQNERILRCPFSLGSVLECASVATEVAVENNYVNSLKGDVVSYPIAERQMKTDYIDNFIYDSSLGIYTVAAHHLSNSTRIPDLLLTFEYAYTFSKFVLNIPKDFFAKIKIPQGLEVWNEGPQTLIDHHDRGFLYFLLVHQLTPADATNLPQPIELLKLSLSRLGLSYSEILKEWDAAIKNLLQCIGKTNSESYFSMTKYSQKNIDTLGMLHSSHLKWDSLELPPVKLNDGWFSHTNSSVNEQEIDKRTEALAEFEIKIDEFRLACTW